MMKRTLWISVGVVAVFALSLNVIALNALAQPPAGGQRPAGQGGAQGVMGQTGGGASAAALLRHAEVVRMLTLTEAQTTALNEILRPGQGRQGGQGGQGGGGGQFPGLGQGGTAAGAGATTAMQQRNTEMWAGIDRVLNTEQQTRFREIFFQANGGMNAPMLDAWMLAVVDLTPAQKEAIAEIAAARTEATRAAGGFGGGQFGGGQGTLTAEERQARIAAAQERSAGFNNQIRQTLTQEQRTRARQLTAGAAAMRETLGFPALPVLQGQGQGVGPGQRGQGAGAQPGAVGPGQRGQGAGAQPGAVGPGQRGQGAGAQPGAAGPGQRGGGQGGGGGFVPGSNTNNWQPGQGARGGAGAGARGAGGGGGARGGGGGN